MSELLSVSDLQVRFPGLGGDVVAVDRVSFAIGAGEILGIVGESGSGKSTVLASCIKLVPPPGKITGGSIRWRGTELTTLPEKEMRLLRGREIGMIFQDPFSALHPSLTIGRQIENAIRDHRREPRAGRRRIAIEALGDAGVPHPAERLHAYPHQLSGGLCQRVVIAMALVNRPALLLADEPTTALDVTVQAEILDLLARITEERGVAIVFVTHNFGIVAHLCQRTIVMQHGKIVEESATGALFRDPEHAYTRSLLAAVPRVDVAGAREREAPAPAGETPTQVEPALRCAAVTKHFHSRRWPAERVTIHALDDVDLDVVSGETLGLVGESGAGKTTLARCLVSLTQPTSGSIYVDGQELRMLAADRAKALRREVQFVFQNPYSALNPRMTVFQHVAEPMRLHRLCAKPELPDRVATQLQTVGLSPALADRYPRQLSGGERQRVVIARALAVEPNVLIADEPVSALDVSIQMQIVELFAELKRKLQLRLVIVAHDLGLVRTMCDRVAVMYLGKIVEIGSGEEVFTRPRHPYTAALIASAPIPDPRTPPRRRTISGEAPSAVNPPRGCRFHPRCPRASTLCRTTTPELAGEPAQNGGRSRQFACFHPLADAEALLPAEASEPRP